MDSIKVVLADDHTLVRTGIRALLESIANVQVVAEASNGREAVRLAETLHPHLVLMDIAMQVMNGLEATARITKDTPQVKVIILSMHTNEEYVLQALRSGASGYLLKDAGIAELEIAIQAVARGETYLSPPVSRHVIADYVRRVGIELGSKDETSLPLIERLTPRQREILQLIAEGHSTQEIAAALQIGVKTVETHRSQLMDKLNIHDVAGLTRAAIRYGLVSLDR